MAQRVIAIIGNSGVYEATVFEGDHKERWFPLADATELRDANADCVICPGFMGKPLAQGAYHIDEALLESMADTGLGKRLNDTARFAHKLGQSLGIEAFALTTCNVALGDLYCATGLKAVTRQARFDAAKLGAIVCNALDDPKAASYIVIDVSDETTVAAYRDGELAFVNDAAALEGPMGLTSAGDLPLQDIVKLAKGVESLDALRQRLYKKSGLLALWGQSELTDFDDETLAKVFAYSGSKWAGKAHMVLHGHADAVVVCCASELISKAIVEFVGFMGNVITMKDANLLAYMGRQADLLGTLFLPIRN